jgi:hypothetical protein
MIDLDIILRLLSTGGIVTLVGLWWRRDIALRKISSSEAGDLRDHYAKELAEVRSQRLLDRQEFLKIEKHLRGMIEDSDRRHEECETARRAMRIEMDNMHAELEGLKRQVPVASADKLLVLEGNGQKPSDIAPHAAASAGRVKRIGEGDGGK